MFNRSKKSSAPAKLPSLVFDFSRIESPVEYVDLVSRVSDDWYVAKIEKINTNSVGNPIAFISTENQISSLLDISIAESLKLSSLIVLYLSYEDLKSKISLQSKNAAFSIFDIRWSMKQVNRLSKRNHNRIALMVPKEVIEDNSTREMISALTSEYKFDFVSVETEEGLGLVSKANNPLVYLHHHSFDGSYGMDVINFFDSADLVGYQRLVSDHRSNSGGSEQPVRQGQELSGSKNHDELLEISYASKGDASYGNSSSLSNFSNIESEKYLAIIDHSKTLVKASKISPTAVKITARLNDFNGRDEVKSIVLDGFLSPEPEFSWEYEETSVIDLVTELSGSAIDQMTNYEFVNRVSELVNSGVLSKALFYSVSEGYDLENFSSISFSSLDENQILLEVTLENYRGDEPAIRKAIIEADFREHGATFEWKFSNDILPVTIDRHSMTAQDAVEKLNDLFSNPKRNIDFIRTTKYREEDVILNSESTNEVADPMQENVNEELAAEQLEISRLKVAN